MFALTHRIAFGGSLTLALFVTSRALAVAPQIKDDGKFFSEEAIKKANKQIKDIARNAEKDLLIETVLNVPGDQAERVKNMSREDRQKFFKNWAQDRADAAVVNGVYILVCRDPTYLEVIVTAKARASFGEEAYKKLRDLLLKDFREKKFDEGLQEAVNFVQEKLAAVGK
jgi:uncharacterized membrane protein YgcG